MDEGSDRLHEILDELHELLESETEIDREDAEALKQAATDIRGALGEEATEADSGLLDQLNRAVERFEGQYPKLTELVGRIADALSDIGI